MPLDGVCLSGVVAELAPRLVGLRIDKVRQPVRDQVILSLRGNLRLLLSGGAGAPRLQLTETAGDNPAEPPMFCMLLRKHLVGGRIAAVTQPGLERLVEITIDVADDFGQPGQRTLVLEAIGRHANLILLDGERRIVDCLRRVDAEMSPQRQVLPGLFYELPPTQGKRSVAEVTEEQFFELLAAANPERQVDAYVLDSFFGVSPLVAREIAHRAAGATDARLCQLDEAGKRRLWETVAALQAEIAQGCYTPTALSRDGGFFDFTYLPITQYGDAVEQTVYESFSALMDAFFAARERQERLRARGADLLRTANTARDRMRRKLAQMERDYAETQNRDALRICGDLITANLYRMERGSASFTTENFYDENGGTLTMQLDPLLTPQQNAAKYYKRYAKARTAEKYLREQMELAGREEAYLGSVLEELAEAETEQDFLEIRGELRDAGYLRRTGREKKELKRASRPREFRTDGGFRVLVGRSNHQNDKLTLKDADRRDLWLHTQKIHGAHVILCTGGADVPPEDLTQAACIAAYYSQARESGNVPVDYTMVKNVKKPAGGRPGMVIYPTYQTLYVTPEETLVRRLSVKA